MSRMLSKMNLISVVQQLPKDDVETIQGYVEMIEEENERLKKQLEEINKMIEKCGFVNIEQVMLNYCGLLIQQKEFINYLNSYIDLLNDKPDMLEETQKDILEEILQKYKSIIGDIDDKK